MWLTAVTTIFNILGQSQAQKDLQQQQQDALLLQQQQQIKSNMLSGGNDTALAIGFVLFIGLISYLIIKK